MCETFQFNHPKTKVMQSDFHNAAELDNLIENIESELKGRTLQLLAGGPPCQGFSTAGKWNPSDIRNSLLFKTIDIIRELEPEHVLLENVPGIRSMQKGKLLESFICSIEAEGYSTQIHLLRAERYGVPQRRRRVFIVGNRNEDQLEEPDVKLAAIARGKTRYDAHVENNGLPAPVNVSEAISDIPPIDSGEGVDVCEYDPEWITSDYQRLMRGMITQDDFFSKRTK
jgi:DNA (cytosine-5)-methyltransferase 1